MRNTNNIRMYIFSLLKNVGVVLGRVSKVVNVDCVSVCNTERVLHTREAAIVRASHDKSLSWYPRFVNETAFCQWSDVTARDDWPFSVNHVTSCQWKWPVSPPRKRTPARRLLVCVCAYNVVRRAVKKPEGFAPLLDNPVVENARVRVLVCECSVALSLSSLWVFSVGS